MVLVSCRVVLTVSAALVLLLVGCAQPRPTSSPDSSSPWADTSTTAPAQTSRSARTTTASATAPGSGTQPTPTPRPTQAGSTQVAVVATAQSVAPLVHEAFGDRPAVVVRGTYGTGLWVRDEPGGTPIKVWPENAPMAVIGADQLANGRAWKHVQTLDGVMGWAAADYLEPTSVGAALESVGISAPARDDSSSRANATPAVAPRTSATATPQTPAASARSAPAAPPATPTPLPPTPVPPTPVPPTPVPPRQEPTKPAMTPVPLPPVSQLDPRLVPAYQALVTLPKIGPAYAELVKKTGVRFAVDDLAGAWGTYNPSSNVITIDQGTLAGNDPRAVAAVLAHEITHATQTARGQLVCLERELEAHKVMVNVWEAYWSNQTPPVRTLLEYELGDWLDRLRRGGDPGMRAHLSTLYQDQCSGR